MAQAVDSVLETDIPEDRAATGAVFSQEQLEAHAIRLARAHTLSGDPRRARPLLTRLDDSAESLDEAYQFLSTIARTDPQPVASEDWLRDNFYIVQDQVREVRQDLPKKYYLELPKLAEGAYQDHPRVYLVARELIAHTAGRLELDTLVDFVTAYQQVAPLSIGEVWAIPIMLRLALVEELARLVDGVMAARRSREQARRWQSALGAGAATADADLHRVLGAEAGAEGRLSPAFVVELLQWLRDQPTSAGPAWAALQRALEAQHDTADEMLRGEHQREAADQVAMGNIITSMRLLSAIDWPLFFDRVSVVEQILRGDPVAAYGEMDFPTRDRYRHSIEQLAKGSNESEIAVAHRAVALAREAREHEPQHDRRHHVGYYLISRGRFVLEQDLGYPPMARERLSRFVFKHPAIGYLGMIAIAIVLGVASVAAYAARRGATAGELWLVALVVLIPVSELAVSLLNGILTSQVPPRPLPKLALRGGIPAADRTLVVVPAIIDSESQVEPLLQDLEVRFLANRDAHLHFALLGDFSDAGHDTLPRDEALVETARRLVDELNARHGDDRFLFLHRRRQWNAGEGCWMGWERKRGKLVELNRLLRGATDTSFAVQHGDLSVLTGIRYVITLDSDTKLPLEAGRRLVGTLSHPLNRPRFDPGVQRVTQGYGVLQPRVQVGVESANRTPFAKVFAGHVGVDPYTTAVSDVYQDLFHEGSFVGKGIYDVDAFEASLAGRVPDNTLLSHDLFEGVYARAGLCTDIDVVDDYPPTYLAYAARQHRWVRGDWQIARWLWWTVPDASGRKVRNTLPAIARWKILDNLRRSLLAPALVILFVAGWTVLPGSASLWSALALLVLAFPAYVQVGRSLTGRVRGVPLREHVLAEHDNLLTSVRQAILSTVFLLHQSGVMMDAILRTVVRMTATRTHLLEWMTAERVSHAELSGANAWLRLWIAPAGAVAIAFLVSVVAPDRLVFALPVLVLWLASPAIAQATGRPSQRNRRETNRGPRRAFRALARRTWRFFDDFVTPADHWLVPDNIQENRRELVARRTSPTNIGLQLLATVAAHDLGYVNTPDLLNRLEPTFGTLLKMHRYRGHFYNWYDTHTLDPLPPAYISTVDSGNFAGYLVTLRSSLVELVERTPIIGESSLDGLADTIDLVEEEATRAVHALDRAGAIGRRLKQALSHVREVLGEPPATLADWSLRLAQLHDRLAAVGVIVNELEEPVAPDLPLGEHAGVAEATYWLDRAASVLADRQDELQRLAPWAAALDGSPGTIVPPAAVPSLLGLVEWSDRALQASADGPLRSAIERGRSHAIELMERAERIAVLADDLVDETEFDFLFNRERQLFSIGFNVADGRLDTSYYDTLASEARLASFLAIATGAIAPEHWFKLGRSLTPTGARRALLSWSASMFEYLMPLLVMRSYPGTLLDETYDAVVRRQIQYGASRRVPWGISESAYDLQDLEGNYQYRAFGVPGLGLKRGLADDLVVAPYASVLAAPIAADAVSDNLARLRAEGMAGRYGYYEAIDYTESRRPKNSTGGAVLPAYMAHHQGMSLLALDNAINGWPMQARFHADPRVQAAELLLQERIPRLVPLKNPPIEKAEHIPATRRQIEVFARRYVTPHTASPRTHLLSNGSYAVMLTNAGGGYSRRQNLAMTRWREDLTRDAWGTFLYVRDLDSRDVWSAGYQPTGREPDEYEVTFAPDRATWRRVDGEIELRTEIVVSPEDDVEIRRVSLTNHSDRIRRLDVTSYAEVVLAPPDSDLAHPAFSNLFVETIAVPERDALICARRPRTGTDRVYLFHVIGGRGRLGGATEYETDRLRFIGRGKSLDRPDALFRQAPLSNTTGAVLDPIVSLRQTLRIPAGGTARLTFSTGFADTEGAARHLIEKYHDRRTVARSLALASTHNQIELRHLGLTVDETMRFQRLAGRLIYSDPRLRSAEAVMSNRRSQSELWKYGISGDTPILLMRLSDVSELPLFRELVKAHEYLRLKGFSFDLVALNEHSASYLQDLQQALMHIVESGPEQAWVDRPGGVFVRRADLMPPDDQTLLRAAARVVLAGTDGKLREQLKRTPIPYGADTPRAASFAAPATTPPQPERDQPRPDLEFANSIGGFAGDGHQYVLTVNPQTGVLPPAPWSNVVAHATFGFTATESGAGQTWSLNSHDNRLTPWRNDPVSDTPGEVIFIRDEDTGRFWSTTPLPAGTGRPYTVRHGQGHTSFEHQHDGVASTLVAFVPPADAVKVFHLKLTNCSARRRRLTVTFYVEWVLGETRSRSQQHIVTRRDAATGAVLAQNAFRQEFAGRVAFADLSPGDTRTITGDRTEFIGRNGSLRRPAALTRESLSGRTGAALDPCAAIQVSITLEPSVSQTLIGLLGDGDDADAARETVQRYRDAGRAEDALARTSAFWNRLLGTVVVRTPDRSLDLMLNRWLPYQTLACRIWGRSAFYQSSGAFGFRDQLQDVLALMFAAPQLTRGHILHAASRQFVEGDVQHWWHEPGGQGVRTRFSDDRLWLVFATLQYIAATGDAAILDEQAPFLEGRVLNPAEHEAYEHPTVSRVHASLYEHCRRALALNLSVGPHGLPLIGTGDWNDGMSMVGPEGRGESVWLAWFLRSLLPPFADVAARRGDDDLAAEYRKHAHRLTERIEQSWDGAWYRRAYFDDGTPLGSQENSECRIDAIAQSWSVIDGSGDPGRARQAMTSVDEHLVRRDDRIALLLTPPFDHMQPSPGYIQGYLPGVRENGGQYTHAAAWTVMAFALLGDGDRAMELFSMMNPINHTRTPAEIDRYRAEPYVVAADVYSRPPHNGRGGWTWYTGSAGWMYRVGLEWILGLTLRNGALHIDPCIPRNWPRYEATLRTEDAELTITIENPAGVNRGVRAIELDGAAHTGRDIALAGVTGRHTVRVVLG